MCRIEFIFAINCIQTNSAPNRTHHIRRNQRNNYDRLLNAPLFDSLFGGSFTIFILLFACLSFLVSHELVGAHMCLSNVHFIYLSFSLFLSILSFADSSVVRYTSSHNKFSSQKCNFRFSHIRAHFVAFFAFFSLPLSRSFPIYWDLFTMQCVRSKPSILYLISVFFFSIFRTNIGWSVYILFFFSLWFRKLLRFFLGTCTSTMMHNAFEVLFWCWKETKMAKNWLEFHSKCKIELNYSGQSCECSVSW